MKLKKHSIIQNLTIEKLGYGGVGIATHESGRKILIKHALPGSIVTVKIFKNKKDYSEATIVSVESVPQERIANDVKCPHYVFPYHDGSDLETHKTGCGGCRWQVVPYARQLELKQATVDDAMRQIIQEYAFDSYPIVPSPLIYQYRNKIEFSFGKYLVRSHESREKQKEHRRQKQREVNNALETGKTIRHPELVEGSRENGVSKSISTASTIDSRSSLEGLQKSKEFSVAHHRQMGFHKQGEFSKVVDINQCFLVSEKMHRVYDHIKSDLLQSGIPVYDVKQHTGCLRHLVIREGVRTDQLMVNLALSDTWLQDHPKHRKKLDSLIEQRSNTLTEITTMVMTINNGLADIVHGRDSTTQILRGEGVIYEGLQFVDTDLLKFQVSPFSFFQTNTVGAEVLFAHAKQLLSKSITGNIIDLYCGSGTIGLSFLAQGVGQRVYGIEIVESAVTDAARNAIINGLSSRAEFHAGKAEKLLMEGVVSEQAFVGNDLIIIDPPRSGLHPNVVKFLRSMKAKHDFTLLYISCNPVTMARDLSGLLAGGVFKLTTMQSVDMFPQTHHVEVIGVMK